MAGRVVEKRRQLIQDGQSRPGQCVSPDSQRRLQAVV